MTDKGGLLAKATDSDSETAHVILEKLGDVADVVTPSRVVFASLVALIITLASLFALVWVVPYDNVDVEVVYMQSGSGHIVLAELDNKGSRSIEDVSVTLRFLDSSGSEVDRHDFYLAELPAHSSVSNTPSDDLEMIVLGQSVWEEYVIEVTLEYRYYGGEKGPQTWAHNVGEWTREAFVDEAPFEIF
ncbi:MAG: hypothetical protein CMA88_04605 [Euryarchaeota archaeon]|nr:hypothetical protein [Euryarchaeota archaeon]|tara:strand:- start:646 stop:1209 length:564 start_codon:yes stop_codon:yes gene_type:complete